MAEHHDPTRGGWDGSDGAGASAAASALPGDADEAASAEPSFDGVDVGRSDPRQTRPSSVVHAPSEAEDAGAFSAGVDAPPARGRSRTPGRRAGRGSFVHELPFLVLVAFLLALLIKVFLVQAFWIPSGSMERTLLINDRVLVNKVVYRFRDVHRGEIVVFNGDGTGFQRAEVYIKPASNVVGRVLRDVQNLLGLGAPSDKDFIKRVIGVGGDTVACCDDRGQVTVNGRALDEPYVYGNSQLVGGLTPRAFGPVTVPKGQLWVMGDHRGESSDSRVNGTIPQSKVIGRAFVRVWPLSRTAVLRVPSTFSHTPAAALGGPLPLAATVVASPAFIAFGAVRRRNRRLSSTPSTAGASDTTARDRPPSALVYRHMGQPSSGRRVRCGGRPAVRPSSGEAALVRDKRIDDPAG